jgi:hypothetical protein
MLLVRRATPFLGVAALVALAACSDDDGGATGVGPSLTRSDTVDTRVSGATGANPTTRWRYVNLENPAQPLQLTDEQARASTAWDVAFNGFSTQVNGGLGRAGGISVFCVCQNSGTLTGTALVNAVRSLSSASEAGDFEGVSAAQVPAETQFRADTLLGIQDWYSTGAGGARAVQPYAYVLQRPNGLGYAKFQVTAVQNASGAAPGAVTFRYATIPPNRSGFGAIVTQTVQVPATGVVRFSFTSNAATTAADWDVAFEGWRIYTNSGASAQAATAGAGAYNGTTQLQGNPTFEALAPNQVSPTANAYRADGTGVFSTRPTWAYEQSSNTALPTYDVYLLKKGNTVYKLQVTGYRRQTAADPAPVSGFVSFRSARL